MACSLNYYLSLTGDCSSTNSGAFTIDIAGTAPNYTIQWVSPSALGTISLGAGVTAYTATNLSAGTYTFNVIDSCSPINTIKSVNVYISSGTCVTISDIQNTTCSLSNGSLTATTSNIYGNATFKLYDSVFGYITSGTSLTNNYVFSPLSASTYYVIANDGGGCSGKSETTIIKTSTTFDYGLYVVNDAGCAVNSGKIFVTGLTGEPPYTYLWSNGNTTSSITGLTADGYSVTVTDNTGCAVTKAALVENVPAVGFGSIITSGPNCFASDGSIDVIVTGGIAPFYYSASTGFVDVSFDSTYTFTNLGAGYITISVTDAGLCTAISTVTLLTPSSFNIVSITTNSSSCSLNSGSIGINIVNGTPPYIYTLVDTSGTTYQQTTNSTTWNFQNLYSGSYTLTISDGGSCIYTNTYTINNVSLFNVNLTQTGTTCGLDNGIVDVVVSGGTPPYNYQINGGFNYPSSLSSNTFTNLSYGTQAVTVSDNSGCAQTFTINVDLSQPVDFILTSMDDTGSSNGSVTAYITSGTPPFTLNWSGSSETGTTLSNLSAGTYTLTIIDSIGCAKTRSIVVNGVQNVSSYQVYNACNSDFTNNGEIIQKGPQQMLLEGFYDLTSGDTNCILNSAIFEASVTISGITVNQNFYLGHNLYDVPTNEVWAEVISNIISSYDGIGNVTYDLNTNQITIQTNCESGTVYLSAGVYVSLNIYYDISCVLCV